MKLYQRAGSILAREGVSGLYRRALRRVLTPRPKTYDPAEMARARAEYARLAAAFAENTRGRGPDDLANYYWYHTIDLGGGLVTPGDYDYRAALAAFHFPDDMSGMDVLDVGSATGFFAFEFERRGARAVSLELPSLADWDMLSRDREEMLRRFVAVQNAERPEQAYHRHLEGPFAFCRDALRSRVRRCHARIYDLTPATVGADGFDLIFVGDVLPHTWAPLPALDRLASLCCGTLVISQDMVEGEDPRPLMQYIGGDSSNENRSWWLMNQTCLEQMLRKLGFTKITAVGQHTGVMRRAWRHYDRLVIHATK
jgi:SAM-dependent methyltransferase